VITFVVKGSQEFDIRLIGHQSLSARYRQSQIGVSDRHYISTYYPVSMRLSVGLAVPPVCRRNFPQRQRVRYRSDIVPPDANSRPLSLSSGSHSWATVNARVVEWIDVT
jgi:hypothetical protein